VIDPKVVETLVAVLGELVPDREVTPLSEDRPAKSSADMPESLTERELDVLELIAEGDSNQEIARKLVVTVATVKTHVNHIFGKLGAESRVQVIARARAAGLLPRT
jgi:DNA-binding NarL/FixJ family response regulator